MVVNLLPVLDGYVMGYQERCRYLDEPYRPYAFDRSGNATSLILVSGRAAGVWDWGRQGRPVIRLYLFDPVADEVRRKIWQEAENMGTFIFGGQAEVRECPAMGPLTERSAGSMIAPLKEC
jgi:hypothetical protein